MRASRKIEEEGHNNISPAFSNADQNLTTQNSKNLEQFYRLLEAVSKTCTKLGFKQKQLINDAKTILKCKQTLETLTALETRVNNYSTMVGSLFNIFSENMEQLQNTITVNQDQLDGKAFVKKRFAQYVNLSYDTMVGKKKITSTIQQEIQKQKAEIERSNAQAIYLAIDQYPATKKSSVAPEHKMIYLKEKCYQYSKHLKSKGKSAKHKLLLVNFMHNNVLNNPSDEDPIGTFAFHLSMYESELREPRENWLTRGVKAVICFLLPFDIIIKKLHHVHGDDFVDAVKPILSENAGSTSRSSMLKSLAAGKNVDTTTAKRDIKKTNIRPTSTQIESARQGRIENALFESQQPIGQKAKKESVIAPLSKNLTFSTIG